MVTNITVGTVESTAVIYLQDGSHIIVDPQSQKSLQLVDNGFCTISEAADPDTSEHPDQPPINPPPERLAEAWKAFWNALKDEIQDPSAEQIPA